MLSCYQFMKQYFYYKNIGLAYKSYFYAVDKNFNLKLSKLLYYIKMSRLFADVLMFKNELP